MECKQIEAGEGEAKAKSSATINLARYCNVYNGTNKRNAVETRAEN